MPVRVTGMVEWQRVLKTLPPKAKKEIKQVGSRGGLQIKKDWARRWSGYRYLPQLPGTINYDVTAHGTRVDVEVGPDLSKQRQSRLGKVIEYGSLTSAPIPGGAPALDAEEPKVVRAVGDMGEGLLDGRL